MLIVGKDGEEAGEESVQLGVAEGVDMRCEGGAGGAEEGVGAGSGGSEEACEDGGEEVRVREREG